MGICFYLPCDVQAWPPKLVLAPCSVVIQIKAINSILFSGLTLLRLSLSGRYIRPFMYRFGTGLHLVVAYSSLIDYLSIGSGFRNSFNTPPSVVNPCFEMKELIFTDPPFNFTNWSTHPLEDFPKTFDGALLVSTSLQRGFGWNVPTTASLSCPLRMSGSMD